MPKFSLVSKKSFSAPAKSISAKKKIFLGQKKSFSAKKDRSRQPKSISTGQNVPRQDPKFMKNPLVICFVWGAARSARRPKKVYSRAVFFMNLGSWLGTFCPVSMDFVCLDRFFWPRKIFSGLERFFFGLERFCLRLERFFGTRENFANIFYQNVQNGGGRKLKMTKKFFFEIFFYFFKITLGIVFPIIFFVWEFFLP